MRHGWTHEFGEIRHIEVYEMESRDDLLAHLRAAGECMDAVPEGLVAASKDGAVYILAADAVQEVRPEFLMLPQGWERLIAHEFAHLLHELRVGCDPECLGPRWFFEGLACWAAGQRFIDILPDIPIASLPELLACKGRVEYAWFEAVVRRLAEFTPLDDLVARAATGTLEISLGWK